MPHAFTPQEISDFEALLSPPRFATYLREVNGDRHKALELYLWNTELSAALFVLLQFCEVAVRNAAVQAIEAEFGPNWHLNRGFVYTLAASKGRYQPRRDLTACAAALPTAGKVVAELKFAFWQYLFVKAHDGRLWNKHFSQIFPAYDAALSIEIARTQVYSDLEVVRRLRNRIAHHEPIFSRNLADDKDRIFRLITWRRPAAATWLASFEKVSNLLATRPA
jgi:hypothetical protein